MKKHGLAYLIDRPFKERDIARYGVLEFHQKFNISVLEFSSWDSQEKKLKPALVNIAKDNPYPTLEISDKKELHHLLTSSHFQYYIDLLGADSKSFDIRKIMHAYKIKRIKFFSGLLPVSDASKKLIHRFKAGFKKGSLFKRFIKFIFRQGQILSIEPNVDIAVYTGDVCLTRFGSKNKHIIWAHSHDYQIFLDSSSCEEKNKERQNYAVFLDQMAPNHPDYNYHPVPVIPPVKAANYYSSMNRFFDNFEKQTNMEVIIAGHPRMAANEKTNPWGNRRLIIGNSPTLIKDAALVFAHYSTAIGFAVLWHKPIFQLTTNEYMRSHRHDFFLGFSDSLNLELINVDNCDVNETFKDNFLDIDLSTYQEYINLYLKPTRSNLDNLWVDVSEYIRLKANEIQIEAHL